MIDPKPSIMHVARIAVSKRLKSEPCKNEAQVLWLTIDGTVALDRDSTSLTFKSSDAFRDPDDKVDS